MASGKREPQFSPGRPLLSKYRLTPDLCLSAPILQAPLGRCDGPRLAAAVSHAGGLGCLTVQSIDALTLRHRLGRIRVITTRPVLLAFTTDWEPENVLTTALDSGFRHIHVFWWNGARLTPRIHRAGGTVLYQVGTIRQARDAIEIGANILVAQGTEAGGQVRSPRPVLDLVRELRAEFGTDVPIVATGGFADAHDVRTALLAGADAVSFGTRFLLSEESNASARHKARLLRATEGDLFLDLNLIGNWPCAPRRRLRTATDEEDTALFAGLGIGRIHAIAPAGQLVRDLTPRASDQWPTDRGRTSNRHRPFTVKSPKP